MYYHGSAPTNIIGHNQHLLSEKHPGHLTLNTVFLNGPASALSSSFTIVEHHLPEVHAYANDTQLYIAFKSEPEHAANAVAAMQACITDIRKWLLMNNLMLNYEKT